MKTRKTTLGMEALADRCMMSASPIGEIAAPMPEPEALTGQTVRLRIATTNNQGRLLVQEEGTAGMLEQGRVRLSSGGAGAAIELENALITSAHGDPTAAKIVVRWEKISVPMTGDAAEAYGKQNKLQEVRAKVVADIVGDADPESIWFGTGLGTNTRGFQTPIETTTFRPAREAADDEVDLGGESIWTPDEMAEVYKVKSRARLIGLEIVG